MAGPNRVFVAGGGTFLPGEPIPVDRIDDVLGRITGAPPRIRKWYESSTPIMRELLAIERVHYAIDPATGEFTEDNVTMSVKAARIALEAAGMQPGDVDLLCYGSAHQDQMPTASVRIQEALGIDCCEELSIHANCTSAYKALYLAHRMIESGRNRNALAISSSISSSELRAGYMNQALVDRESLFLRWFLCDGAGAVVLTSDRARSCGLEVETTHIESPGGRRPSLMWNDRPARWMNPRAEWETGAHHLRQRFANALSSGVFDGEGGSSIFACGLRRMMERAGVPAGRVRILQINMPTRHVAETILDECEGMGIPRTALYTSLDRMGYCGPPMALICLDEIARTRKLDPGDRVASFVTEVSKFMQAGYVLVRHDG